MKHAPTAIRRGSTRATARAPSIRIHPIWILAAYLGCATADAAPRISATQLSRTPAVCSVNSASMWTLDVFAETKLQQVYVAVVVRNDDTEAFGGFLRIKAGSGYSRLTRVGLQPSTSDTYTLLVPLLSVPDTYVRTVELLRKTGPFKWDLEVIDESPLVVEVRDATSPTVSPPQPDALGQRVLIDPAVGQDPVGVADLLTAAGNAFCAFSRAQWGGAQGQCFAGIPRLHEPTMKAIKQAPQVALRVDDWHAGTRDMTLSWRIDTTWIPAADLGATLAENLRVAYDREVIMLLLPENVVPLAVTPSPSLPPIVANGTRTLVWIGNGTDKRLMPGRSEHIDITVSENAEAYYSATIGLFLDLGPFADKASLEHLWESAPQYDYALWQTRPDEAVWLTLASAVRTYSVSSRTADLGYNPIFREFPYDLVPDYGATPQIRFDQYLRNDLPPEVLAGLRFSFTGSSNIPVTIDQAARRADIHLPPDWAGEEQLQFTVTDPQGRRDTAALWVTSPLVTTLTRGLVEPASGTRADAYTFSVTYTSPSNAPPKKAVVVINGIPHNMTRRAGSPCVMEGAVFEYLGRLSSTENSFHFEFEGSTTRSRYPPADDLGGPILASLHDVAVRNFVLDPNQPRAGDVLKARARVENLGTEIEPNVPVVFMVNGSVAGSQEVSLPVDGFSPALEFAYTVPISDDTETYLLSIAAGPVPGETNMGDNVGTGSVTVRAEPGAISGWVFDQYNIAVEGAVVKVVGSPAGDYGSTTTDADGYFILDGLKPGAAYPYTLEASSEGGGSATKAGIIVHSQQTTQDQVFNLYAVQMDQLTSGYMDNECDFKDDGTAIVFARVLSNRDTVTVVNADGSSVRYLTGDGKAVKNGLRPKWSPNGQAIAFNGYDPGPFGIYVTAAAGDGTQVQCPVTNATYPTWSPDSQWIAYVNANDSEIYKIAVNGGTPVPLSRAGNGHGYLAWSPDGAKIAFAGNAGQLGFLDVGTGAETLVGLCVPNAVDLCWLRDSSGILFAYGGDIWLYYLADGACTQITYEASADRWPSVPHGANAPDLMCFSSNRGATQYNEEYIFVTSFSAPQLYFKDLAVSPNPFTPNGDGQDDQVNITYTLNKVAQVTLKMHDSQGRYIRTVAGNVPQAAGTNVLTWDGCDENGNRVNDEVYSYRLVMQDGVEVARPAHGFISLHKAIVNIGSDVMWPTWSRQGDAIVYLTPEKQLYMCDAPDCTNKRPINTQPFDAWRAPDWSGSGEQIVFPSWTGADNNTMNLAIVGRAGGDAHEIDSDTYKPYYPRWSPTSDEIVYEINNGNAVTGEYGYLDNYELVKIGVAGGGRTRLTYDPGEDEWPSWSPDGSKIAWSTNRTGNYEIWIMNADGSGQAQFTRNPWYDVFPEWTPDGRRLLFCSNRHLGYLGGTELWTQPLDGSDKARHLASVARGVPSPSGDRIVADGQVIELFLSLTKGALEGRVVDEDTSQPIEGATVYLYRGSLVAQTTTNNLGGYQLWNVEPGTYLVKAGATSYVLSGGASVDAHAWVVSKGHDVTLKREPAAHMSELPDGERIGSTISLNTRQDAGDVAYVESQYRAVGGEWQSLETTAYPQPGLFDTAKLALPSGQYQLRAVAVDDAGNRDSSPQVISVEVDHTPPSASVTAPVAAAVVHGTVNVVAACAAPDLDSVTFQYRRRGEALWINIGPVDVVAPWSAQWRTDSLADGEFELRAVAMDDVGNADQEAQAIEVTVRNVTARGDVNCDGLINNGDIDAFVLALTNSAGYATQYPGCNIMNADINGDGLVNNGDIDAFVALLTGGPPLLRGDTNCDGLANNGDIDAFVLVLTNPVMYAIQYPGCDVHHADVNGDGLVNNGDIDAFVALLTGGGG